MKNKVLKSFLLVLGLSMCLIAPRMTASAASSNFSKEVFDATYYYNTYPDVQSAIGNNEKALLNHYINHGLSEGRSGSATFNATIYLSNYPDLYATYGTDLVSYCYHYMNYGKGEGRNAATLKAGVSQITVSSLKSDKTATNGTVLGTYSTSYDTKVARATNVALAVSRLNGTIVNPGETFSFSTTILPRTPENGYVEAPVYINKQVSTGIGGGICQVSSTLYAAMRTAGIQATERHAHSLPVSYIPEEWDATISGNVKDLKFKNTYNYPILITATTNNGNGTITVSLIKQ